MTFPGFDEVGRTVFPGGQPDVANFLHAKLNRMSHGQRSRVEVIYLENSVYFDEPYGGSTAEDKLRRARMFGQSALEALRCHNYYPTIIQTNEWQQLGLELNWNGDNFIKKQGALMRQLKTTEAIYLGIYKGTCHVPKQVTFKDGLGDACRVDGDQGLIFSQGYRM